MSEQVPPSLSWTVFAMMTSPGAFLTQHVDAYPWPLCLLMSAAAFGLFLCQAELDLGRVGATHRTLATLVFETAYFGIVVVVILAAVAWGLSRIGGGHRSFRWTIKAFALGFSPALVYGLCGLVCNVGLGWNTALAFGVTGFVWTLRPMLATLRELTGSRTRWSITVATVCGWILMQFVDALGKGPM